MERIDIYKDLKSTIEALEKVAWDQGKTTYYEKGYHGKYTGYVDQKSKSPAVLSIDMWKPPKPRRRKKTTIPMPTFTLPKRR